MLYYIICRKEMYRYFTDQQGEKTVIRETGKIQTGEEKTKLKKYRPILWMIFGVLAAEIFLFNFSAWKSLFYKERIVFEQIGVEGGVETAEGTREYVVPEGTLVLHVAGVDRKIHNLFFAVDFSEEEGIPYTVTLTDEGNYYPYSLPERMLMPGIKKSYYTNIYPSGKAGEITVQFTVPAGSVATVNAVCANARIPWVFSIGRVVVLFGAVLLFYRALWGEKRQKEAEVCLGTKKQMWIAGAAALLMIGMAWKLAHVNPICVVSPWPHHKQYQELAEALAEGHCYLDFEPSEGLLNAPNPYDTIYLQANGIDYRADYAYFEGKYYVYFGVVPELLLYLPCYLLTGRHLPNYIAVFLFYSGFILAVFALFWEMVKRWFSRIPFFLYLLVSVLTVCAGNYLFVIARPDLYDVPIMAANMFTAAGLWLWIRGKYTSSVKGRKIYYALGSLSMALVAGCRPQMLLFSFLAIPLFWEEVMEKRELFGKKNLWDTFCLCIPYLLVAAGIMYYNAARFGSPFDFGASYSLTSNDMTKRGFNVSQALLGIWHYFFRPPVAGSDFPYLEGVQIASGSYMGKLNAEYTYGGLLAGNAFLWLLFRLGRGRELLKKKRLYGAVLTGITVSAVLAVVDVTGAGILQRYMVDMIWGVWLAVVLVCFALGEKAMAEGTMRRLMVCLAVVCILQAFYGFGVVFGNGDLSVNVRTSNPELYYWLEGLMRF